jgi:hypothetical protein
MPRSRKSTPTDAPTVSLPSGGTAANLSHLSSVLGLPTSLVESIMTCQGFGVRARRGDGDAPAEGGGEAMTAMSNVWGDWMSEEMTGAATASTAAASAPAAASATAPAAAKTEETKSTGPRSYILPLRPPSSQVTPGLLLQTGTLDSTIPGRGHVGKVPRNVDLECPTQLIPGKKFVWVATSATSCHSVGITQGEFTVFWLCARVAALGSNTLLRNVFVGYCWHRF